MYTLWLHLALIKFLEFVYLIVFLLTSTRVTIDFKNFGHDLVKVSYVFGTHLWGKKQPKLLDAIHYFFKIFRLVGEIQVWGFSRCLLPVNIVKFIQCTWMSVWGHYLVANDGHRENKYWWKTPSLTPKFSISHSVHYASEHHQACCSTHWYPAPDVDLDGMFWTLLKCSAFLLFVKTKVAVVIQLHGPYTHWWILNLQTSPGC